MEITKKFGVKMTPTCVKETLERKEKSIFKRNENAEIKENDVDEKEEQETLEPVPNSMPTENTPNGNNGFMFQVNENYPELTDVQPNVRDVRTLKRLTYGRDGEMTAILTYMYQNYISTDENLKYALEQIAIVEMRHLEMLSDAIVAFGGDPTLTDGMGNVWTGRNVNYTTNPIKFLKNNIKSEDEAVEIYMRASRETTNESLSQLYKRIAEDEKLHAEIFQKLLDQIT